MELITIAVKFRGELTGSVKSKECHQNNYVIGFEKRTNVEYHP